MIIQGSNCPLVIQFDAQIDSMPALVVTLWPDTGCSRAPLKTWYLDDMTVSGDTAVCPLTEKETAGFPDFQQVIEAKGLDENGNTIFWDEYKIELKRRRDRIITLTQTEG